MGNKERPILIIGKDGTGKTTMAKSLVEENAILYYANELEDRDWKSVENDIIIEEVHYKPNKKIIMDIIRNCRNKIILTSLDKKSVPKEIQNCCKNRLAGSNQYEQIEIKRLAPRSQPPHKMEQPYVMDIVRDYLKNPNREEVLKSLKFNKPPDVQIMTWLGMNLHPNKLIFIDAQVRRRWSTDYFYELLAYAHDGRIYSKLQFPKKATYSKVPTILRKLKIKPNQGYLLPQLLKDSEFEKWAKRKLRSEETRVIGIKDKVRPRNAPIIPDRTLKLEGWF